MPRHIATCQVFVERNQKGKLEFLVLVRHGANDWKYKPVYLREPKEVVHFCATVIDDAFMIADIDPPTSKSSRG